MDQLRHELDRARGHWPTISRDTGVDYFTIARIARGETENPRINTVERIQEWLIENQHKHASR
jgi:predicted transcriptional regulator